MPAQAAQGIGIGQARTFSRIQAGAMDQVGDIGKRAFAARLDNALRGRFGKTRNPREAQTQGM